MWFFSYSAKFVVAVIINKRQISLGTKSSLNINYSVYGTTVLTNNDFLIYYNCLNGS